MAAVNPNANAKLGLSESKTTEILRWTTKVLFAGARKIVIEHDGVEYSLRLTSQDKLILTK
ncbi:MAG: hemin uptake protein HemP [Methylophilaceae bacterium]|nr:hemin uptake protein HemP [Methylophilaceae bacterium]